VKNNDASLVTSPLRIEPVSVERSRTRTSQEAQTNSSTSTKQTADQRTGSGTDPHVDQIAVTTIEARSTGNIPRRTITRRCPTIGTRRSATRTVSTAACLGVNRQRQPDCKNQKHHCGNQKLFHRHSPSLNLFSSRRDCVKFFERDKRGSGNFNIALSPRSDKRRNISREVYSVFKVQRLRRVRFGSRIIDGRAFEPDARLGI